MRHTPITCPSHQVHVLPTWKPGTTTTVSFDLHIQTSITATTNTMSGSRIPTEAPPSYDEVTGSSNASTSNAASSHLNVPGASSSSSSVPESYRRSMEDEARPLPKGWVRTYDPESEHQFFVDTTADPPRSIWHHPYDDDEFLAKLPAAERERIEQESMGSYLGNAKRDPSMEDYIHAHSDIDDDDHQHAPQGSAAASSSATSAKLPPRPDGKNKDKGKDQNRSFGRKLKDKVTGTTHEERQRQRAAREAEQQRMYEQHMRIRKAMAKAIQTGEPQPIGKDKDGKELYISPPKQGYGGDPYASGYGGGMGMGGYGNPYNPYASGMYAAPGMYARPGYAYGRPMYGGGMYGRGYGGSGLGMPLALGGGLLGGALIGGALF